MIGAGSFHLLHLHLFQRAYERDYVAVQGGMVVWHVLPASHPMLSCRYIVPIAGRRWMACYVVGRVAS